MNESGVQFNCCGASGLADHLKVLAPSLLQKGLAGENLSIDSLLKTMPKSCGVLGYNRDRDKVCSSASERIQNNAATTCTSYDIHMNVIRVAYAQWPLCFLQVMYEDGTVCRCTS